MKRVWPVYACELLSSIGGTLLMYGIFFYTRHRFGWGLRGNFLLAAAEGAAYVAGSMSAGKLAARFGRRRVLAPIFALSAISAATCAMVSSPGVLAALLVVYLYFISSTWPVMESLATTDVDSSGMSRRVGIYNLVWSVTNMIAFAISGAIIEYAPVWFFLLPAVVHGLSVVIILTFEETAKAHTVLGATVVHAEPELFAARRMALWLSRICLPATYVVIYSLTAMMPSLSAVKALDPKTQTIVAAVWMGARVLAFLLLGFSSWWHTRPRILLVAGVVMLIAFVGVTMHENLAAMLVWQIALGMSMGVIYAASLYFGMVLSDGSTEHGGYHEALIGLGSVLGPGVAALVQWRWAGNAAASVAAVAGVVVVSLLAATAVSMRNHHAGNSRV